MNKPLYLTTRPPSNPIIKTQEQIIGIRKASRIAANTLEFIGPYVKVGISTAELDHLCNAYILSQGAISACIDYKGHNIWGKGGYTRATCISRNSIVCHGVPRDDEFLCEGDILNIDITVIADGFFGDTSSMFQVGKTTPLAKRLIEITRNAREIGIQAVKPGGFFGDIGAAIALYVEKQGMSVVRDFTGHGVGVYFHEEPYVYHKARKGTGEKILPGMVFTIEPMVNTGSYQVEVDKKDGWTVRTKDKSLSAQFEHTLLVTDSGCEILTLPGSLQ